MERGGLECDRWNLGRRLGGGGGGGGGAAEGLQKDDIDRCTLFSLS